MTSQFKKKKKIKEIATWNDNYVWVNRETQLMSQVSRGRKMPNLILVETFQVKKKSFSTLLKFDGDYNKFFQEFFMNLT